MGADGMTVVLGLEFRNLDLLAQGRPITFSSLELGLSSPVYQLIVCGGASISSIVAELHGYGVDVPEQQVLDGSRDGFMLVNGTFAGRSRPRLPFVLAGISAQADRALRAGREFPCEVPRLPGLRLIAGADYHSLAAVITAGKPVYEFFDRRGGRD